MKNNRHCSGDGATAVKYLGAYVARTALGDSRMAKLTPETVSFQWKNRDAGNRRETVTLAGVEFVRRYLRHVMPPGLRTIRYYGFCHPASRAKRLRVQMHSGACVELGAAPPPPARAPAPVPCCPSCQKPMFLIDIVPPLHRQRGPP